MPRSHWLLAWGLGAHAGEMDYSVFLLLCLFYCEFFETTDFHSEFISFTYFGTGVDDIFLSFFRFEQNLQIRFASCVWLVCKGSMDALFFRMGLHCFSLVCPCILVFFLIPRFPSFTSSL